MNLWADKEEFVQSCLGLLWPYYISEGLVESEKGVTEVLLYVQS